MDFRGSKLSDWQLNSVLIGKCNTRIGSYGTQLILEAAEPGSRVPVHEEPVMRNNTNFTSNIQEKAATPGGQRALHCSSQ
eukprot:COSAG02_NODE_1082_length_14704_cov_49.941664_1_plen_80_part_00